MPQDAKLAWVWRNHGGGRGDRADGSVGSVARRLLERSYAPAVRDTVRVAEALATLVDEQFRATCRVASLERGLLTIAVARDDLVWELGRRWHFPLLRDGLPRVLRGPSIRRIRFQVGDSGVPIPAPPEDA
ncbi:MAG TPA: hypothetical protein PKK06_10120 [Phycisphaerae bacterium]|nr:hypothetical protein [Phycisphaerae bacterium]HNU45618.1 hypothetical protein [Phycisphaerae bacterium]